MAAPTRSGVPTRADASMLLLTNLTENSLDEGYAEAAARRAASGETGWRPGPLLALGLLCVGLLLATAAVQVRDRAPAAAAARAALSKEIEQRTAATDRLEQDLVRLRESVAQARHDTLRLTTDGAKLASGLTDLEAATGAGAVTGPALVVHLEDAATSKAPADSSDPREAEKRGEGRVSDRDLQTVVNELWAAGAEAIAVNGQRLTALSAIRSAGQAVLVGFRPLSPPYDVVAVGDAAKMQSTFVEGFGGSYLQVLRSYGIHYSLHTRDDVRLPASAGVAVRYAEVPSAKEGA